MAKISQVKRNNQKKTKLTRQGKSKNRRHKPKKQVQQKVPVKKPDVEEDEGYDEAGDLAGMIEADDMKFLNKALQQNTYSFYNKIRSKKVSNVVPKETASEAQQEEKDEDDNILEERYERNVFKPAKNEKPVKYLLPLKTSEGLLKTQVTVDEDEVDTEEKLIVPEEGDDLENDIEMKGGLQLETEKPMTTVKILALREEIIQTYKRKIGIYSREVLANPELKIKRLQLLLKFMDERTPGISVTVRKLTICSLCQIFVDLLPSYKITLLKQEGVKLKKDTLKLQNYEAALLNYYKHYLQRLEKIANLARKKGSGTKSKEDDIFLAKLAVESMCELLVTHQYFNFSANLVQFLVPFLNNKHLAFRETLVDCITKIFKDDKKEELSLQIVRRINKLVKTNSHSVQPEVLKVLLQLPIKDINLDQEKEEYIKEKKLAAHKQRILSLSKKEKKKKKQLKEIEQEMLETKAEENKQQKKKALTEITSLVFTIYFRILKEAPKTKVLTVCLEGLAKFAHCINIEFYQDLVNNVNNILEDDEIGLTEQLYCIKTVFIMLAGPVSTLNIDPARFYNHLYRIIANKMTAGRQEFDVELLYECILQALLQRYTTVTKIRFETFIRRMVALTLTKFTNGLLGLIFILKKLMQTGTNIKIQLDTDCGLKDSTVEEICDDYNLDPKTMWIKEGHTLFGMTKSQTIQKSKKQKKLDDLNVQQNIIFVNRSLKEFLTKKPKVEDKPKVSPAEQANKSNNMSKKKKKNKRFKHNKKK